MIEIANSQASPANDVALKRTPIVIVLITAAFVTILNQTLLTVAFPYIMKDFRIDANMVQ